MKYQGKAQDVAEQMIGAFENGRIPKALSQIFIHRDHAERPCDAWSISNRILIALCGHVDARGFRQWKKVGRSVRKGESACYILVPITARVAAKKKDEDPSDEASDDRADSAEVKRTQVVGFKTAAVFGYAQTEGDPLPGEEEEAAFFEGLPLVEVARAWGLKLHTLDSGRAAPGVFGTFRYFRRVDRDELAPHSITLSVQNLSTWAHELVHAADAKRGTLTPGSQQHLDNEIVAELGGAVLLECIGRPIDSDRGGAWSYIRQYAEDAGRNPVSACTELLERVVSCVTLVLDTADELGAATADPCTAAVA